MRGSCRGRQLSWCRAFVRPLEDAQERPAGALASEAIQIRVHARKRSILRVGLDGLFQIAYRDSGISLLGVPDRHQVQPLIVARLSVRNTLEVGNGSVGCAGVQRGGVEAFGGIRRLSS